MLVAGASGHLVAQGLSGWSAATATFVFQCGRDSRVAVRRRLLVGLASRLPWNALAYLTLTPGTVEVFGAAPRWLRSTVRRS
jgi:hypothetical protein